jgi:hypothetical protein
MRVFLFPVAFFLVARKHMAYIMMPFWFALVCGCDFEPQDDSFETPATKSLDHLAAKTMLIPDDERELLALALQSSGSGFTDFVRFDVGSREIDPSFEAAVWLTTETGQRFRIRFKDQIQPGQSSQVSLNGESLRVVKVDFHWRHDLAIKHHAVRVAKPGKFFEFAYIYLNDFVNSDRDLSITVRELDLASNKAVDFDSTNGSEVPR